MALKNMIKVGDKVAFGRSGEKKQSGTVVKKNPKTARIKVSRCGEFLVTYNLIQKPSIKKVSAKAQVNRQEDLRGARARPTSEKEPGWSVHTEVPMLWRGNHSLRATRNAARLRVPVR